MKTCLIISTLPAMLLMIATAAWAADIEIISKTDYAAGFTIKFRVYDDVGAPVATENMNFAINTSADAVKKNLRARAETLLNPPAPPDLTDIVGQRVPIASLPTP
jgi:hypothetical protein